VVSLEIDANQYPTALANIAVTFFTAPVLAGVSSFSVPLPAESGCVWNWITAGAKSPYPLTPNAVDGTAVFGYSPQRLVEGWLDLVPAPPATGDTTELGSQ
jgi:hypothetical protein